ncbi:uncharacterized protein LOC116428669 [Nomia melanderi]|uniref:uncharacterized protein LOC116428669 n=1 Tax=Nomia melanderi TaxID=2448451 RepID=UPI003FCCC2C3
MANNEKISDYTRQKIEKDIERPNANRLTSEQKMMPTIKDKIDETRLPTPLSDPWMNQWHLRNTQSQPEMMDTRNIEEDEDILVCFADLETPLSDSQTSECPSRNSTTSTITVPNLCLEEAFEQLNRLYSFTEQILELRQRTSKFFKRVRNLEKLKVLRNANRALEDASTSNYDFINDFCEEDTGFADSLLDAMISNCREPPFQRWNIRPPSSRRARSKFDFQKQTSGDSVPKNAPNVSKWTRVKAAFKWERAYANDIAETTATMSAPPTPVTPTTKHLSVPSTETGDSNSSSPSSYIEELSDTTSPFCRTWTSSLPNEVFHERSPKNMSDHLEHSYLKMKEDQKKKCMNRRSQSLDRSIAVLHTEQSNQDDREKQAIRGTEEKSGTMYSSNGVDEKVARLISKTPTPTLTVTIPTLDDDIRCVSSAESNSSLSSCTHTSAGNFPLFRNVHSEQPTIQRIKRQQSAIEESMTSRVQRQNSRWNKVRRAFLTSSTHCIPPSPVKDVSRHVFFQNGQETSTPDSCSASAEDLEIAALNAQSDTRRDYRVLRQKLGTEFHRKLIEWERLKNLSPSPHTKRSRDVSSNFVNSREHPISFLSEESLSFEFRKKLQDWKRIKKERRGSAPYEQQRFNRRRLTDWQLWKSPLKIECRHREITSQHNNCGESVINGDKSHLPENFFQKLDVRKRINETTNGDVEHSARPKLNRLGIGSGIDESEFLTLEKALSLFNGNATKKRRENDAQQPNKFFDGNAKSYVDPARNINYTDEVLVQTAAGSYRFEGISQEFTRKLYDWEKFRGISPGSSTFRLLGHVSEPVLRETNIEVPMTSATKLGCSDQAFYNIRNLRRSKSADNPNVRSSLTESFIRRSMSLQLLNHLEKTLKDSNHLSTLLISNDRHEMEEITEDILMDDSEPEAMIVDIEDVIEETASPLKRMQPHQTPVYSVATSETTSIAVPLGTVTSSHQLSPLLLIEIEENSNRKRDHCDSSSKKDSSSFQDFDLENVRTDRRLSLHEKDEHLKCSSNESFHHVDPNVQKETVESENATCSIDQNQTSDIVKKITKTADKDQLNDEKKEILIEFSNEGDIVKTATRKIRLDGSDKRKTIHERNGKYSTLPTSRKESTDLSSEKRHEKESDDQKTEEVGDSCNVENVTDIVTEHDNKYENVESVVDPYYCSLIDTQPLTNYKTCNKEASLKSSGVYKSEKPDYANLYHSNRESENGSRNLNKEHSLLIIKSELDRQSLKSCTEGSNHEKQNNCIIGGAIFKESMVTQKQRQEHTFENISTLKLPTKSSDNDKYNIESPIRTVSSKSSPCHEKPANSTVSDSCAESMRTLQQLIDESATNNLTRERDCQSSNNENAIRPGTNTRKPYSPTRNVFTKTKRIIFSPFRREDYRANRKESKSFEDNQTLSLKNEDKSRSASPKINRRDILVRTSFSLPWALCLSSKKIELKETKTKEADAKAEADTDPQRDETSLSSSENNIQKPQTKCDLQSLPNVNATIGLVNKEKKTMSSELHNRTFIDVTAPRGRRQEEEKGKAMALPLEFNPNSADLMHKLQILSGVVARRDGRNNAIPEELSVESHSLRTRRAKEDFLSRRGGPLFHSVMEPPTFNGHNSQAINDLNATERHNNTVRSAKASNSCDPNQETTKVDGDMTVVEEGLRNANVSLPIREKSASIGVINVDPDVLKRLMESDRGCESLPRTNSKQQQSGGSLTKIINKFNFVRLICGKEQNNLSTIARLCRQSLLIDIKNDVEQHWEIDNRADKASKKE